MQKPGNNCTTEKTLLMQKMENKILPNRLKKLKRIIQCDKAGFTQCKVVLLPKVGVRLLAAQKPIKRQGLWKGKFALFQRPAAGGGNSGPKADSPHLH